MIRSYQTIVGAGGDCFRACIASLLDLSTTAVPHFYEGIPAGERLAAHQVSAMFQWFKDREMCVIETIFPAARADEPPDDILLMMGYRYPTFGWILVGQVPKGVDHAVVCRGAHQVFDPSGSNFRIIAPATDKTWHVYQIGKFV